jgi:hypothetical protein
MNGVECKRAWGLRRSENVNSHGATPSADLGGSSKYSSAHLKTEVGKGSMGTAIDHG